MPRLSILKMRRAVMASRLGYLRSELVGLLCLSVCHRVFPSSVRQTNDPRRQPRSRSQLRGCSSLAARAPPLGVKLGQHHLSGSAGGLPEASTRLELQASCAFVRLSWHARCIRMAVAQEPDCHGHIAQPDAALQPITLPIISKLRLSIPSQS